MGEVTKRDRIYDLEINDSKGEHNIQIRATQVERKERLSIEKPLLCKAN